MPGLAPNFIHMFYQSARPTKILKLQRKQYKQSQGSTTSVRQFFKHSPCLYFFQSIQCMMDFLSAFSNSFQNTSCFSPLSIFDHWQNWSPAGAFDHNGFPDNSLIYRQNHLCKILIRKQTVFSFFFFSGKYMTDYCNFLFFIHLSGHYW